MITPHVCVRNLPINLIFISGIDAAIVIFHEIVKCPLFLIHRMEAEIRGRPDFQMKVICSSSVPKFAAVCVGGVFEDSPPEVPNPEYFI